MIKMQVRKTKTGFTLVELMVSMAVGLTVIFAMATLFKSGMASTFIVAQRVETQQNMRAAMEIMVKDINMAGAGLPTGGLQLPTGAGSTAERYGCDQGGTCYVPVFNYPGKFMNGITPGFNNGVQGGVVIPAAPALVNDSITVVYCDYNFPLFNYNATFPAGGT